MSCRYQSVLTLKRVNSTSMSEVFRGILAAQPSWLTLVIIIWRRSGLPADNTQRQEWKGNEACERHSHREAARHSVFLTELSVLSTRSASPALAALHWTAFCKTEEQVQSPQQKISRLYAVLTTQIPALWFPVIADTPPLLLCCLPLWTLPSNQARPGSGSLESLSSHCAAVAKSSITSCCFQADFVYRHLVVRLTETTALIRLCRVLERYESSLFHSWSAGCVVITNSFCFARNSDSLHSDRFARSTDSH